LTDTAALKIRRQAVLAYYRHCFFCDAIIGLEDHHIVRRAVLITRWDWRNGIPVCQPHHRYAETAKGRKEILAQFEFADYLSNRKNIVLRDYCQKHNITIDQFMQQMVNDALDVIAKKMIDR
jgi:hypothetical protein